MYRDNIYEVIKNTGKPIDTLIIPKNSSLRDYVDSVLNGAGLEMWKARRDKDNENKLRIGGLNFILKRGEDIPQVVANYAHAGKVVLGITGDDLYDEFRLKYPDNPLRIENTYDWYVENARFKRPALCLINKTGQIDDIPLEARIALNSKYVATSKEYLSKSPDLRKRKFKETTYGGDTEEPVALGASDCCIEIVYTGSTLKEYGLKPVQIIRFSDIVVISPLKR